MGRDKAWLPFGGDTLLGRITRTVAAVVPDVRWVARAGQDLPRVSVPVLADPVDGQGPLAALASALPTVPGDLVFVTACDMPWLRPGVIARLFELIGSAEACVPEWRGHAMTMCAVYRRRPAAAAASALVAEGELRMRALAERLETKWVDATDLQDVDPELDSFVSCDTPDRYAAALARIAES